MLLVPLLLAAAPTSWVVDDDGPADFSSIAAAVAAVAPGDTLLVMPGSYGPALVDKALSIVGPAGGPRPQISGELTVKDAGSCTLAGLEFQNLRLEHLTGRSRVDDCLIEGVGTTDWGAAGTFVVSACAEVEITRTTSHGKHEFSATSDWGSSGLTVEGSRVELVDCVFVGGSGYASTLEPGYGWDGVFAWKSSDVLVAGSRCIGGDGMSSPKGGCGFAGGGINCASASFVNVRGSSQHLIAGGYEECLLGYALHGLGITWSGVSTLGFVSSSAHHVDPPEPYLAIGGVDGPGGSRRLKLYAPAGSPALALGSLGPALLSAPGLSGGSVWIDPAKVFVTVPLVTAGQDQAATQDLALPSSPSFAGISALFQAAVLTGSGSPYLTNSSNVVLRF